MRFNIPATAMQENNCFTLSKENNLNPVSEESTIYCHLKHFDVSKVTNKNKLNVPSKACKTNT
jgi:hypothetical protein